MKATGSRRIRSKAVKGEFGGEYVEMPKDVDGSIQEQHSRSVVSLATIMRPTCVLIVFSLCLWSFGSANLMNTMLKWASVAPFDEPPSNQTQTFAEREGYQSATHRLVTDDGYYIQATRIFGKGNSNKPPVLLTHGLLSASDNWLVRGSGLDLPYILADQGHDVWLGDWRGNCYSKGHQRLSTSNPLYWNFTYYHRALHDLPAFIDLVLSHSSHDQLIYIGYSYGSTAYMVLSSMRPEYANKRIRLSIMLAPVGYKMRNPHWSVRSIVRSVRQNSREVTPSGMYELFPRSAISMTLMRVACGFQMQICLLVMNFIFGQEIPFSKENNKPILDRITSGTSILDVVYLSQLFIDGFNAPSYGPKQNLKMYGQINPPPVEVEKVTIPTALFYSINDHLNSEEGVYELSRRLQNVVHLRKIPDSKFSHVDYMWGKNVENTLYKEIVKLIGGYSSPTLTPNFSSLPYY